MKRKISILLILNLALSTLALFTPALAASTIYTNKAAWETAVGYWMTEDFSDATFNPGVSVDTDVGYVDLVNYLWWDRVDDGDWYGDGIVRETTWIFDSPIMAWGGTFDTYIPGGPGSSIRVTMLDGSEVEVGVIPNTIHGEFWGFVSDKPFVKVHLFDAELIDEACETYEMDDMVYTELVVEIDIKPWSCPNSVNRKQHGVIPVGILGSELLDVTILYGADFEFMCAGPAHDLSDPLVFNDHIVYPYLYDPTPELPGSGDEYMRTANNDLIPDLVVHFNEDDLCWPGGLKKDDTLDVGLKICLDGMEIWTEMDTIRIVK